ncbi:cupin domain-containing protein [Parapedobacter deserti]
MTLMILFAMGSFESNAQPSKAERTGHTSEIAQILTDRLTNNPVIVNEGEGETLEIMGSKLSFKLTTETTHNQTGLYEVTLAPQVTGAKLHYHRFMDETFVVTQGTLTIQLIDREVEVAKGGVVHIPRFTPHGFYNGTSQEVKALMLFNPPQQREDFFRGMKMVLSEDPVDPAKFLQLYHKYDSHPIDESEAADVLQRIKTDVTAGPLPESAR